jgi:mutual gliding-motility protein MglA
VDRPCFSVYVRDPGERRPSAIPRSPVFLPDRESLGNRIEGLYRTSMGPWIPASVTRCGPLPSIAPVGAMGFPLGDFLTPKSRTARLEWIRFRPFIGNRHFDRRSKGPQGSIRVSTGRTEFVAFFNLSIRELHCKIVYWGPGRCGKTSNLHYIYARVPPAVRGKLISIDAQGDRTAFFDFLPLDLGTVGGLRIRVMLYTVPGDAPHRAIRQIVLQGVDGVVFVADSMGLRRERNIESLEDLTRDLEGVGKSLGRIPLVIQYNKRDLGAVGIPVSPLAVMERDLNRQRNVPALPSSAASGEGVFETLRMISKLVTRGVARKVLHGPEAIVV